MAIDPAEINTIRYDELPPDGITVDSLFAIANGTDLYKLTAQQLIDFMNINVGTRQYQFIELYVDQAYIDDNFDSTGLGVGICEGIAICNGNNGTPNDDGNVHIAYGTNYSVINAVGGSKDAVVVAHTHDFDLAGDAGGDGFITFNDGNGAGKSYTTESTGVSGTNKNMPPYRVVLRCMKL